MEAGVLYAIKQSHTNGRPGFVTDPGQHPGKVGARIYWSWPARDGEAESDWLEADPNVIVRGKADECRVTTADVLRPWAEYVEEIRAERQARLDERAAEDAAREAARQEAIDRVDTVLPWLDGLSWGPQELAWAAKSGNMHTQRWTASQVLDMIEHLVMQ